MAQQHPNLTPQPEPVMAFVRDKLRWAEAAVERARADLAAARPETVEAAAPGASEPSQMAQLALLPDEGDGAVQAPPRADARSSSTPPADPATLRALERGVRAAEAEIARWASALLLAPDGRALTDLSGTTLVPLAHADSFVAAQVTEGRSPLVVLAPSVLLPAGCPIPPTWPPPDDWWSLIVVGVSGGKDSLVLADQAVARYGPERCLFIYNLLGDEHITSPDQVAAFARARGVPYLYTWKNARRETEYGPEIPPEIRALYALDTGEHWGASPDDPADIVVTMAERRGSWPGPKNSFCTSDAKRTPSDVVTRSDLVLQLADERGRWPGPGVQTCTDRGKTRPTDTLVRHYCPDTDLVELPEGVLERRGTRVLFLTGERAAESPSRAKKPLWQVRDSTAPSKGRVVLWHRAIHPLSDDEVWAYLIAHQIAVPASYWGLYRHSCRFCIYKAMPEMALMGLVYPLPLARRVEAEERMGHRVSLGIVHGPYKGFRAVWEFLYGPWPGAMPAERPSVRPEAQAQLLAWWSDGTLHRPPHGALMAGPPEVPPEFVIEEPEQAPPMSLWDFLAA